MDSSDVSALRERNEGLQDWFKGAMRSLQDFKDTAKKEALGREEALQAREEALQAHLTAAEAKARAAEDRLAEQAQQQVKMETMTSESMLKMQQQRDDAMRDKLDAQVRS